MNTCDESQQNLNPRRPELGEHVLQTTLAAVRVRRRRRRTRNRTALLAVILAIGLGSLWLTGNVVRPGSETAVDSTRVEAAESAGVHGVSFSTVEVGSLVTVVFQTLERPPAAVFLTDQEFLEFCGPVGGGLVTLADNRRIALVGSSPIEVDTQSPHQP